MKLNEIIYFIDQQEINGEETDQMRVNLLTEIVIKVMDAALSSISLSEMKCKIGAKVFLLDEVQECAKSMKQYRLDLGP